MKKLLSLALLFALAPIGWSTQGDYVASNYTEEGGSGIGTMPGTHNGPHNGTGDIIETTWIDVSGMERTVKTERLQGETIRQRNWRHREDVAETLEFFPKPPPKGPHRPRSPLWDRLKVEFAVDYSKGWMEWSGDGLQHKMTELPRDGQPVNWFVHETIHVANQCLDDFPE